MLTFTLEIFSCQLASECTNLLNTSLGQRTLANVKQEISKFPLPKKRSDLERANREFAAHADKGSFTYYVISRGGGGGGGGVSK